MSDQAIDAYSVVDTPTQNVAVDYDTDPNAVVRFTQKLRYKAIDHLTSGGTKLPDKIGDMMMVLRDMDQSALTTRKLNIEEKVANDGRKALETYTQLREMLGGRDPLARDGGGTISVAERMVSPIDNVILPDVTLMPGEDHQGEQTLNVSDYVAADE